MTARRGVLVGMALSIAASAGESVSLQQTATGRVSFVDVAASAGLTVTPINGASDDKFLVETMGSGAAFLDYDADGWIDLFLVDGGAIGAPATAARARHRLMHNERDGTFRDVTAASGIDHREYGQGTCVGDVDNDGRPDIYVTNYGPNQLFRNRGDGRFVETARAAGVALAGWSTSCAFLDIEPDGDLDLFITNYLDAPPGNNRFCGDAARRIRVYCHPLNYPGLPNVLYRNDGMGQFTDFSQEAGIARHVGNGLGVAVGDYDADGLPDVFVANDAVPNFLFHNLGNGKFEEIGLLAGVAVARDGRPRAGMGTDFGDYDGDGRLDLVVTNHEFETHSLFRNAGNGLFVDATVESAVGPPTLPYVGFGTVFFDFDNSGRLDLAIVNGHVIDNTAAFRAGSTHAQRKLLFRNTTGRRFLEVGRESGPAFAKDSIGRTLLAGDVDNDGDLDLLVTNNGRTPELLRNDGGRPPGSPAASVANALLVRLVGTASNRDGIGARITAAAGTARQVREVKSGSSYLGQSDLRAHFGLGERGRVDRLEIRWPSGRIEALGPTPANQILTVTEGKGITARSPFVHPSTRR